MTSQMLTRASFSAVCLTVFPFEFRPRTFTIGRKKLDHIRAYDFGVQFSFKVARNEVENASFAQRSAHRDSRIWRPELIEPAAERKQRARADDDRRSNRPSPTHRFCHSAIFRPITPYNVWFF